jgi:glycosyltransferase involved in cell wall biosynthesis
MSTIRKFDTKRIKKVEYITDIKGNRTIDLPPITEDELPGVSVVTITKNRKRLFPIAIYNWLHFLYPHHKIEWIIADDSDQKDQDLTSILPKDDRIKYIKCRPMGIGEKRNFTVEQAKFNYISHMDDDDFHFPDSILAKVRSMLKYKKECIYCHTLGVYDTSSETSAIMDSFADVPELCLMYTKKFWNPIKFCNISINDPGFINGIYEAYKMTKKREKEILGIDFWFVCIAITHNDNYTGRLRAIENVKAAPSFYKLIFTEEFRKILDESKKK